MRSETLTGPFPVNGSQSEVTLSATGRLTWAAQGQPGERSLDLESQVLGIGIEDGRRIRVKAFVDNMKSITFSCFGEESTGMKVRRDFILEMPTDDSLKIWSRRLSTCMNSFGRPKRLFVIINPYGGNKCAQKIFDNEIKPLFEDANINYTLQETKYQHHAQQISENLDLLKYDGIVCVSGDGILVEVVNGLLQRDDWVTAIKLPLGIIPAGTGNGMAKSLLDSAGEICTASHAAFSVIRGHKRPLDVTTVIQGEKKFFSVLMLTWGLVADIDIESEKYRWFGSARLDFYSFLRLVNLRRYDGHIEFLPAPGYEMYGDPIQQSIDSKENIGSSNHIARTSQGGYEGPPACSRNSEWRSIDGPFIAVWLNNVPWVGENFMPAPEAKFSDGYLDVVIVKDCPKLALIWLLTKMADGTHTKSPYVMYFKVKAFHLEPGQRVGNPWKGGIIDSDGEVLARGDGTYRYHETQDPMTYAAIQLAVDNALATIFAPK